MRVLNTEIRFQKKLNQHPTSSEITEIKLKDCLYCILCCFDGHNLNPTDISETIKHIYHNKITIDSYIYDSGLQGRYTVAPGKHLATF